MSSDTIIDIYCHIFPDRFFHEMNRITPRLGNIGARLRGVKKLFDLDERFREMDQFGDYREVISLPNPPIEDFAQGDVGLNLARIGNDAMAELCARREMAATKETVGEASPSIVQMAAFVLRHEGAAAEVDRLAPAIGD